MSSCNVGKSVGRLEQRRSASRWKDGPMWESIVDLTCGGVQLDTTATHGGLKALYVERVKSGR